ncbi:uncharacterized mitochondrial protein AtMg00810-like [Lactuca sativa]|uniref:uncharacterized mitochondrial protein AtMg00810-like n=1 Tax=Lactuca sativa TaxID=4236 RepID=UPI000CD8107D|nr:uncharacterized mitochondrial protein AtMg00810-like [Lactuca sativa]
MEPNDSMSVHTVIESHDAIFDEMRFSSIVRHKDLIPSTSKVPNSEKSDDVVDLEKKFDATDSGVIICLYVDDMLIFGTNHNQVNDTNRLLSSKFSMKDMKVADVILTIRIKHMNKGIVMTQSYYIEKILNKLNFGDCSAVGTPIDASVKLLPTTGKPIPQLEYSKAIGSLMYVMKKTRLDITYDMGRLIRYTSNPYTQDWNSIQRVSKYLKGSVDYGLNYLGYHAFLEGC